MARKRNPPPRRNLPGAAVRSGRKRAAELPVNSGRQTKRSAAEGPGSAPAEEASAGRREESSGTGKKRRAETKGKLASGRADSDEVASHPATVDATSNDVRETPAPGQPETMGSGQKRELATRGVLSPRRAGPRSEKLVPSNQILCDGSVIDFQDLDVLEKLGEGAYGRVCKCALPGSQDHIAMKLMKTDIAEVIEDATRELNMMNTLRDVSKFVMHGRGGGCTHDKQVVILLDFMEGGNLLSRAQDEPLDEGSTRFYTASIILGLEALHSKGILVNRLQLLRISHPMCADTRCEIFQHRDIKPENVLIGSDGYVKIADLGFAKMVDDIEQAQWHSVVGTAEYFPPEVARVTEEDANTQGAEYGKGIDLWGLGVTIYNCLTGKRPFLPEGMDSLDSVSFRESLVLLRGALRRVSTTH